MTVMQTSRSSHKCFRLSSATTSVLGKRCRHDGAKEELEAVEGPERKKQKWLVVRGLRSLSGLEKRKQDVVVRTLKKRNKPSGMGAGQSILTRPLCESSEEAVASKSEDAARDVVVISPSNNEVTSSTRVGGCISEEEFKSTCANWRRLKLQRQRDKARRKIESMTCTAGFQDNLDTMREFEKLTGIKSQWMTTLYAH
ncbi:hypothetical protein CDL15_Pgr025546 [Punica granatum]|uniref:Uncharacterized protein n=1 Tax=Punica granatum TaxID=22663 RepID=A0A218W9Y7_PUNGR|nr:hypothetical protein CDL15_Pgr025546 [Punica granatum]PKI57602.1 hypothetical protein CRG98_021930 [Punica granatum]